MTKFKIRYRNPETEEFNEVIKEFEDTANPDISAEEWAEDYAYAVSDKGDYNICAME